MHYLPGTNDFLIGCNYWSSEAGISMWYEWLAEAVEKDFAALEQASAASKQTIESNRMTMDKIRAILEEI